MNRRQLFNYLGLLRLPEAIQEEIRSGVLNERHGRALSRLCKDPDRLANAHAYIRSKKLSGAESEIYVANLVAQTTTDKPQVYRLAYHSDAHLLALLESKVEELRSRLTASENG